MTNYGTYPLEQFEIITRKDCPFCEMAKDLLKERGFRYTICDINDPDLGDLWREKLRASGRRTVPQVYEYNNKTQKYDHIGGYTELREYLNG